MGVLGGVYTEDVLSEPGARAASGWAMSLVSVVLLYHHWYDGVTASG